MVVVKSKSADLKLTRVYDAPVQAVWDAWTDPEKAAKWWGPRGFTITTHSKDLRPGGHWNYTMHGPDGVDYPNKTVYHEVEECKKLVYDHGANDDQPALFRVTVLFSEKDGKTTQDMTMTCESPERAIELAKFIKQAGGNATWDRLDEYLQKTRSSKEVFVINRSFNVSVETMFDMWTKKEHMEKWLSPAGFDTKYIKFDIRPGGSCFSCLSGPNDFKMYGRADYIAIEKPHRIVYTQQFCDENENVTRHPMSPTWPETMLTVIDLAAEGPDQTRVTITWQPYGNVTEEELKTFIEGRAGMTQGWTGSLDKIDDYIETL